MCRFQKKISGSLLKQNGCCKNVQHLEHLADRMSLDLDIASKLRRDFLLVSDSSILVVDVNVHLDPMEGNIVPPTLQASPRAYGAYFLLEALWACRRPCRSSKEVGKG